MHGRMIVRSAQPRGVKQVSPLVVKQQKNDSSTATGGTETRKVLRRSIFVTFTVFVTVVSVIVSRTRDQHKRHSSLSALPVVNETNPGVGPVGHIKVKPTPFVSAKRNAVAAAAHGSGSSKIDPQKLSSTEGMMRNLAAARAQLEHKLMIDYGKVYFQRIFLESNSYNRGRTIFQPARNEKGSSWDRMKRKMMMKLLTVQTKLLDGAATTPVPFVWATGGDSVAAGHGNFYYQSYTAYLERSVTDIFKAVGMEFTGRNYAMGSTQSALEIALCQKEIFGQDVDVLVWDFGMADGSAVENLWLYLYRAGMNRNRPAFIVNRLGRRYFAQRKRVAEEVEDLGLTTFYASEHVLDRVLASVPDSYGLKDAQLKQLPAFVRNLRCEETIEDGRPDNLCEIEKFNVTVCKDRPYRTSWHSGWKRNAIMGNLAAFFLVEVMHDALKEISDRNMDPSTLFKELKAHEDADHKVFMDAQVPDEPFRKLVDDVSDRAGIDIALLAKGHNYCHTARLPSEIRHKGILTAHTAFGYDKGISRKEANNFTDAEGRMRLVRSENDQQEDWQQDDCKNVTLKLDYSDYFYANTRDGMKFITLPNDAEKLEYGNDKTLQGLLAICFAACPWNKCPRGDLDREAFEEGLFEVHVNGLAVDKMVKFKDCELLQHSGGFKWKPDDGRFKFGVRVLAPASFLRIGSFILW